MEYCQAFIIQVSSLIFYFRFFTYYIHPFTMAAKSKLYKAYSQMIDCDRRSDYGGDFYPKTTLQAFVRFVAKKKKNSYSLFKRNYNIVYDEINTHELIKYFKLQHMKSGEIFIFIPTENQTTEFIST